MPRAKVQDIDTRWFVSRLAEMGVSQRELARQLGMDASSVHHMLHGRRVMTAKDAAAIAGILGMPLEVVLRHSGAEVSAISVPMVDVETGARQVPVVGQVDATGELVLDFDRSRGFAPAGADMPSGTVAVQYRTKMTPWQAWDGWTAFFVPASDPADDPTKYLNRQVVAKVQDGPIVLRQLQPGYKPGTFNLSLLAAPDLESVLLDWITPVLMIRPR